MRETTARHPSWRRLVDHRDGVLSGAWRERTETHLAAGCEPCEQALVDIATLRAGIAAGPLPAPPRAALKRARRLFAARRLEATLDRVRTLIGRLVFDQRTELVPALRSAPGTERRLLWNIGEYELFVTVTRTADRWDIQGQFLAAPGDSGRVPGGWAALQPAKGVEIRADLDADGGFVLSGVRAGSYALNAELDGVRGHVPAFTLD